MNSYPENTSDPVDDPRILQEITEQEMSILGVYNTILPIHGVKLPVASHGVFCKNLP